MKKENLNRLLSDIKSRLTGDLIVNRYAAHEDLARAYKDGDYKIRCFLPGHTEDTPSLSVSHDKFLYNCFGKCGPGQKSGDFIDLIVVMDNVKFMGAVEIAAGMCGLNMEAYEKEAGTTGGGKHVPSVSNGVNISTPIRDADTYKPEIAGNVVDSLASRLSENEHAFEWLLNERGLSLDTMMKWQLGVDRYGNISIPIYSDGKLVNIKYRKNPSEDSDGPKYWSHKSKVKGKVYKYGEARLFGPWDLVDGNHSNNADGAVSVRLVICAGEFDCMVLNQESDGSVVAVAPTAGEGMWDNAWNEICTNIGTGGVYVCFDNDEAGNKGAAGLIRKFPGVKKISLASVVGDKGDITDYFYKGGDFDGFLGLMDESNGPALVMNGPEMHVELSTEMDTDARRNLLDALSDDKIDRMNPAFFVDNDGVVYITAMFGWKKMRKKSITTEGEKSDIMEEYETLEPTIISSERGIWEVPRVDRDLKLHDQFTIERFNDKWTVSQEPNDAQNVWADSDVKHFLRTGKLYSDIKSVYNDIYYSIKKYSRFTRKTHRGLVALYIMGSYFYEGFQSYPYMLLTGEKNSGKSTLGNVMAQLSFNGEFTVNPSVAWLARRVEEFKGLIVIDEAENQSKREQGRSALGQVVNSGYKKGARRTICNVDNKMKSQSFDVYCPKVFASIYGLNDVTQSRCIVIRMRRARIRVNMAGTENPELEAISKKMYQIMMGFTPSILDSYEQINRMNTFQKYGKSDMDDLIVFDRERELYIPLLTVAHFINKETGFSTPWNMLIDELKYISEEKDEDAEDEPEVLLRQSIMDVFESEEVNERVFDMQELVAGYKGQYVEDPGHKYQRWISKTLMKMGWVDKQDRSSRVRKSVDIISYDKFGNKSTSSRKVRCFRITRESIGMESVEDNIEIPF